MKTFRTIAAAASISLCLLSPAAADVVTDWNEKAVTAASRTAGQTPRAIASNSHQAKQLLTIIVAG